MGGGSNKYNWVYLWICRQQLGGREGLQAPLEGGLGEAGGDYPMLLLINSVCNKIGDRGCRHIGGGDWQRVKAVGMGINQNISVDCGVREEGCRAMAKWKGHLECISCILVVTQVGKTNSKWSASASWGELLALSIATEDTSDVHALMMMLLLILSHLNCLFEGRWESIW